MFYWKIKYWWKVINVIVVATLIMTVPLSLSDVALNSAMIKLRVSSIGISFLILCEIMNKNERILENKRPYHAVAQRIQQEDDAIENHLNQNNERRDYS